MITPREFDFGRQWDLIHNLHRTGETGSWRAQTKPCAHQDPGERSSDPQKTDPDLPVSVQESPASYASRGIGQWWPATGLGTLSAAVCAWILFQGVSIIFMTSMIVWSQVSCQTAGKEHSPTHQQKIGLNIY